MTRIASNTVQARNVGQAGEVALPPGGIRRGLADDDVMRARPMATGTNGSSAQQALQRRAQTASAQGRQGFGTLGASDPFQANALGSAGGNFSPLANNGLNNLTQNFRGLGLDSELNALDDLGGGSGYFEDKVFGLMIKVVEDMQKKVEERLQKLQAEAKAAEATTAAGGKDTGGESRNIEFEKIKFDMQKLSQMQQAMSNVLNTMDELAKSAIRNIKG